MDYETLAMLVGLAIGLYIVLVIMVLVRHHRTHQNIMACFELVYKIATGLSKDLLASDLHSAGLMRDLDNHIDQSPRIHVCHICGKTDFVNNMVRLPGNRLNKIGLVPLKGALTYDVGIMYSLHADCASIQRCSAEPGWEKIPAKKTRKRSR